jgi:hypothetical protein
LVIKYYHKDVKLNPINQNLIPYLKYCHLIKISISRPTTILTYIKLILVVFLLWLWINQLYCLLYVLIFWLYNLTRIIKVYLLLDNILLFMRLNFHLMTIQRIYLLSFGDDSCRILQVYNHLLKFMHWHFLGLKLLIWS